MAVAAALGLAAIALALYAPVAGYDFVRYDDPNYLWLNPRIAAGLTADNVVWSLTAFEVGNWHPLTLLSHMTDVTLFGMRPGAHHLVNAVLHAASVVLLFGLFLAGTGRAAPSAVVAALFAVHALNVESVAWVSQRKSVLCMAFLLGALLAHVGWSRRGGRARYLAGLACTAAALGAKPMAVVLPVLMLLVDAWPLGRLGAGRGRPWRVASRLLVEKIPHFALAIGASAATVAAQRAGEAVGTLEAYPAAERVVRVVFAYGWYLRRLVWPADLSLFYPTSLAAADVRGAYASAAVLVVISAAALALARRRPCVAFGWAWYVVSLLPVVGLVQFGTQIVADRYAYLALIGPLAAIAFGGADLVRGASASRRILVGLAAGAVVAGLAVASRATLSSWRDSATLFECGVHRAPDNPHVLTNLGLLRVQEGRFDEGIELLERADAIVPAFRPVQVYLGRAYAGKGRWVEASERFDRALRLRGDDPRVLRESARALVNLGRWPEAESRLKEGLRLEPGSHETLVLLGSLLADEGRTDEARSLLERAAALDPGDPRARKTLEMLGTASSRPAP